MAWTSMSFPGIILSTTSLCLVLMMALSESGIFDPSGSAAPCPIAPAYILSPRKSSPHQRAPRALCVAV